jgi:hypothetical protein
MIVFRLVMLFASVLTSSPPATLAFDVPAGWVRKPPSSSMRVAEFTLPRVAGDSADAALAVFYFGGEGGSIQANVDRWIGQMTQPDGRPSRDAAKESHFTTHGLTVTLVDVSGTYTAEMSPGSADHFDKPGFRQCAAVVETANGPYFVKLTGPAKTVARWYDSFMAFLKSLQLKAGPPVPGPLALQVRPPTFNF